MSALEEQANQYAEDMFRPVIDRYTEEESGWIKASLALGYAAGARRHITASELDKVCMAIMPAIQCELSLGEIAKAALSAIGIEVETK